MWGKMNNRKFLLLNIMLQILAIIITIASFFRIFWGTEITDEILAISETDLLLQGATPFVNNWLQTPGFTIFIAGLIKLYKSINNSYEGIFLFSRLTFFGYRIFIAWMLCKLLKHYNISKNYRIAAYSIMVPIYFYFPNFHYNSISNSLLLLSGIYLCWIYQNFEKRINHLIIIGQFYAICIYCHPSEFLPALFTTILISIHTPKNKRLTSLLRYIAGGGSMAIILSSWMILRGGGINKLIYGLDSILNHNPYFMIPKDTLTHSLITLIIHSLPFIFIIMFMYIVNKIRIRSKTEISAFFYDILFLIISLLFILFMFEGIILLSYLGVIVLVYIIWKFSWLIKNQNMNYLFCFICLPIIFSTLSISILSHGSIINRMIFILPTAFIIIVAFFHWKFNEHIKQISLVIFVLLFSFTVLKSTYTYIYRDNPIIELDAKISSGVYKGIYTTESRKKTLTLLETYLSETFTKDDKVLFMETTPFAYLMTDAKACSPSTWDITLYSYIFNDDSLYQRYFKTTNTYPDYIIYINTGRDDKLSIHVDNYNFTKYVKTHYVLNTNKTIGDWQIIIYKQANKNNSQISI